MRLWFATDESGSKAMFTSKPVRRMGNAQAKRRGEWMPQHGVRVNLTFKTAKDICLTWEDEPREIDVKIEHDAER